MSSPFYPEDTTHQEQLCEPTWMESKGQSREQAELLLEWCPLPGGAASTLNSLYYVLDAILELTHTSIHVTQGCSYVSVCEEGKLCCSATSLACRIPTWNMGVQVMRRETSASPIWGGSAVIFCKAGNEQILLHGFVEGMRFVKLPALSCACPPPFP